MSMLIIWLASLKKTRIFAIFIKTLEFQVVIKLKTNSKSVVPKEYHNFLDIFSKKYSNILLFYQNYDYKMILEKKYKLNHNFLYKILWKKLNIDKYCLDLYIIYLGNILL